MALQATFSKFDQKLGEWFRERVIKFTVRFLNKDIFDIQ